MRSPSVLVLLAVALLLNSCGDDSDLPPLVTGGGVDEARADALFSEAQQAEQAGRKKKAIKLYDELADKIPLSTKAPESRYRQAKLLEEEGELLDSFEAYQELLVRHHGSGYYEQALNRQAEVAFGAADGEIRNSFLGLKSKLSADKIAEMLKQVADGAPRSQVAARAEFKTGEIYVENDNVPKAISAFRGVVENYPDYAIAADAQYRIGEILLEQANEGNQDQANLNRAREAFEDYLSQFPNGSRRGEARKQLDSIGSRDLQNTYDIAVFYDKKDETNSARYYYQEVVRKTAYGDLHDKAKARLAELGDGN